MTEFIEGEFVKVVFQVPSLFGGDRLIFMRFCGVFGRQAVCEDAMGGRALYDLDAVKPLDFTIPVA